MTNYKEKTLYHIKRKLKNNYVVRGEEPKLEIIYFEEPIHASTSWADCYDYLKNFTKTTKRQWVEKKKDCRLVIWDTDLEPIEQDCVDNLLEFSNYEKGSFDTDELQEIIVDNLDEPICESCDCLIKTLEKIGKEIIEIE